MSIKYKIISFLILIVILISLPLSYYLLLQQKEIQLKGLVEEGKSNIRMFALSTKSILIMNGGELLSSRLDSEDILKAFRPLREKGLVLAESFLLSREKSRNGQLISRMVLAGDKDTPLGKEENFPQKLTQGQIDNLLSQEIKNIKCRWGRSKECRQFVSSCSWKKKEKFCLVRMVISPDIVLKQIEDSERIIKIATLVIILVTIVVGLILTQFLIRPIALLSKGVKRIGEGDLSYKVKVRGSDEIGKLALAFNEMSVKLLQADKLKDEFLANTSHELRTPLNGIINIAESLIDGVGGELSENARVNISLIISSGKRLSALVNDILDFSKLKNVDLTLNKAEVDLYSEASIALELSQNLLMGKPITLTNEVDPGCPFVWGDENRIQQILINLVGNAIKFTEKGSITISSSINEKTVLVVVADTGIGIPRDKFDSIFSAFEQADGSVSRVYGGTGLGLTICKQLVELHEGKIWIESSEGEGTRIFFTLPLVDKRRQVVSMPVLAKKGQSFVSREISHAGQETNLKKQLEKIDLVDNPSILIVDDDPINIKAVENHLSLQNYQTEKCFNGMDALAFLEQGRKFDLIILDIMMPRMSGFQVAAKIRETYAPDELPIIMLTAKNMVPDILTGFESGANDYLGKPFDKRELLVRVDNLLRLKKAILAQRDLAIIDKELEISSIVQKTILTQEEEISKIEDLEIDIVYKPMNGRIGGDYYNISKLDSGNHSFTITDAIGHGITAALTIMQYDIINKHSLNFASPHERLKYINDFIFRHSGNGESFFSFMKNFFTSFTLNIYPDRIKYSRAGHPAQYLIRKKTKELVKLYGRGKILGMFDDAQYQTSEEQIGPGDLLMLFTDGMYEQFNEKKEKFTVERLEEIIINMIKNNFVFEKEVKEIGQHLFSSIENFYGDLGSSDDLTLITIRKK